MKIPKELLSKFNTPDTFLVISDYPEKHAGTEKNYGIAWHTKELLEPLAKNYGLKFVVLAEKGEHTKPELHARNRILVLRVFDQTHPTLFPRILRYLQMFYNIHRVHVHSEFSANGGIKNFILLIPFLTLIKLLGKTITYYTHNVVLDINEIAEHMNLKKNSLGVQFLNFSMKSYYRLLNILVTRFVVMDQIIKKRLSTLVDKHKIVNLPFWIETKKYRLSHSASKDKLGFKRTDFLLVSFGFITYYKGSDWIIDVVKEIRKEHKFAHIKLVLAGGEAYSLQHKSYYQEYYQKLIDSVKDDANITITGFVAEKDIGLYLTAADLVVLPYRGLIGASGTLTHVLAFKRPFIMSKAMSELLRSEDFQQALKESHLAMKDVTFNHTYPSFKSIITDAHDPHFVHALNMLTKNMTVKRSFNYLLEKCFNEIHNDSVTFSSFPNYKYKPAPKAAPSTFS